MAAGSPGGVEEGRVSIRVVPDTASFAADLRAQLTRITEQVQLTVKTNLDTTGLAEKVDVAVKEIQAETPGINIATKVDTSQLAPLEQGLANAAGSASSITTSIGLLPVVIGAAVLVAAAIAPAFLTILPALGFITAAVGVIVLAFAGLKKVFAPLAKGFLTLQKPITKIVTSGLAPLVKTFTKNVIPVLKVGFSAVATIINGVLKALLGLGQNTKFLSGLKSLLVGAADAFAPLVKTIPLVATAFLQIAQAALPALSTLAGSFAGVLTDFATAISNLAASGQLTTIISQAADVLSSLFGATVQVVKSLLQVGQLLAPVFVAIFDAVGPLVTVIADNLVGAFKTLAPVVASVITFFSNNKTLFKVVAGLLLAIASPTLALAAALVILLANFQTIQPFLKNAFDSISAAVQPIVQAFSAVVTASQGLATTLTPIVTQIVALFVQNWPQIRTIVVQVFSTIQSIVVAVLTAISTQIKIDTAVIGFLWKEFGGIILSTIQTVFPAILTIIQGVLNVIQGVFRLFTDVLKGNWSGAWADIKQIVAGAIQIVQGTVREGLALLKGIASAAIKTFVDTFKGLPGLILSAVGDLSGVLVQAGKDVISGLVKGIGQATVGPLKSALAGVGDFIKDHKGPPSVDKVLLVPAGQQIMGGLIAGLESQIPALENSLGRITKAVKPPSMTGVFDGAAGGAGISGTTVVVQGDVGWSLEKFTQAVDQKARDAATVANLRLALVG